MFCKWCGSSIASSDTNCKRCGKEVPALSDCGGFYDLVPSAKKPSNIQPEPSIPPVKPEPAPRKPEPATAEPAQAKKDGRKSLLGLTVLNMVGLILAVVLLAFTNSKVNNYSTEVNGLRNDLCTISEKIDSLAEATEPVVIEPEVTEHATVPAPVLAEQNVSFIAKIKGKGSAQELEADLDLGDYNDTAVVSYGMDENMHVINAISYALKETGTAVKLTLAYDNEFDAKNLSVSYEIDDEAYGFSDASETYKWQYRFDNDAQWEDIPDTFIRENGAGKAGLSIQDAALQELIADSDGELELRCEISRTNINHGSLMIVIEGIRFYEETNSEEYSVG